MKVDSIGVLARKGDVPWVSRLEETRQCLVTIVRASRATSGCSSPAGWMFTAGPHSTVNGGPFCWSHLMMIMAGGAEQARLEEHLRAPDKA